MIINSAWVRCDSCGREANHPIMYWPKGWCVAAYCDLPNDWQHICPECAAKYGVEYRERVQAT